VEAWDDDEMIPLFCALTPRVLVIARVVSMYVWLSRRLCERGTKAGTLLLIAGKREGTRCFARGSGSPREQKSRAALTKSYLAQLPGIISGIEARVSADSR